MRNTVDNNKIHILGALRCAKKEYNEQFYLKGRIKFGLPKLWVEEGKIYGDGRGDVAEGMIATFDTLDPIAAAKYGKKYSIPNKCIEVESIKGRTYYRRKETMSLPTFCLYGMKQDLFNIRPIEGWQDITGVIPGEYFSAFSDLSNKKISELPINERPTVVFISNSDLLFRRIVKRLAEIGIAEDEIIYSPIAYYDPYKYGQYGHYSPDVNPPFELFFKRNQFDNQSEIRIVVNSKNAKAMDYLRNNVIDIGSLTDIATMAEGYFNKGLYVSASVNIELKND